MKNSELPKIITDLLFAVSNLHLAHWLTTKNHHHVVVGELYSDLRDAVDELAESYIGYMLPDTKPFDALELAQSSEQRYQYTVAQSPEEVIAYVKTISALSDKGQKIAQSTPDISFLQDHFMDISSACYGAVFQLSQD